VIKLGIEINGKEYGFNPDVRLGILGLIEGGSLNIKQLKMIFRELLIPTPTPKELFNMKTSVSSEIFLKYTEFIQRNLAEIKKKLSS